MISRRSPQQGAALVIVMALLAGALMLGVVGVQSALVEERLASNYRASTLAQMRAEVAASQAVSAFASLEWEGAPAIDKAQYVKWADYAALPYANVVASECPQNACFYIPVERAGQPWVMALGAVMAPDSGAEAPLAQSLPIFIRLEDTTLPEGTKATVIWQ